MCGDFPERYRDGVCDAVFYSMFTLSLTNTKTKISRLILAALSATIFFSACAPPPPTATSVPPMPSPTPEWELPGWTLVWQDEFDGPEIDRTKWTFDIGGHGWGNNEWQAYTERPENDAEGNPVEGITVTGGWVGLTSRGETSAESDAQGNIRLLSFPVERQGEITFCVTNMSGPNATYDKSANARNCAKLEK